ncbi:isochorismatase family protein [Yersinia enterocolitica]|nr:isochorismatase family protein [Yersinia enterocolitica]HDL6597109.1 isochorismatase family protein [Yersinia enterocolitica]HDZ9580751.1 isochorismatase family protein [Yersinia enterocolitica]HEB5882988.1 isochorismatase family protein [Yersinia enterocolitica]HED4489571.1 isochorismatase family protein [Yersinia enterocolitica]
MTNSALLIIDVQQSFEHKSFWQQQDLPAFSAALNQLIAGCKQRGVALVDVFHVAPEGPFSLASGYVKPMSLVSHHADVTVQKRVHNALTDSGLDQWLKERQINHLIIAGMRTEQCCETTARVASDLGYQVTFVTEATLTFPMTQPNGIVLSSEELKLRTETVLVDRFATIHTVAQALAALDSPLSVAATQKVVNWQPQPYFPRAITPAGLKNLNRWQLKRYVIRYAQAQGTAPDYVPAYQLVSQWLPHDAETVDRPGIGFVIEHQGKTLNYLIVGWWDNENELRVKVWVQEQGIWRAARDESFCVWDLQVMAFERDAFVDTLLQHTPDIPAYMNRYLTITVD